MKKGNVAVNLSITGELKNAVHGWIKSNPRKGRRNLSEVTEQLWISYLRKHRVKLPPLIKSGAR